MIVGFGRQKSQHLPVQIDGECNKVVSTYKYLGVHLDHKLDWSVLMQNTKKVSAHSTFSED